MIEFFFLGTGGRITIGLTLRRFVHRSYRYGVKGPIPTFPDGEGHQRTDPCFATTQFYTQSIIKIIKPEDDLHHQRHPFPPAPYSVLASRVVVL